ncbi:hypothetical protein LB465_07065 [Salegentibacter sp. LM13S]|uniref:hypothetical protein n=1 Tax=Salegentibacter lacus TaxID=2873599 RepID=UPI001CC9361D|nr:hypothetical protein [Salegentibacter lacus]MBZ9630536.1 hypothetical protein [Salegentibacter lacus]
MNVKLDYESQIERYYGTLKRTRYYSTTQIIDMVGICKRTMRSRIKLLKEKFKNVPSKLYKENNKWYIERSIVHLFLPKYKSRTSTVYNQNWQTFITWITKDAYDKEYHYRLIAEVQYQFPEGKFMWVIEQTENGVNHVHMVSDLPTKDIQKTINAVLNRYIPATEYRLEVAPIRNKINVIDYMLKDRYL